ncbi:hypothetical protein RB623_13565 [Mesorhizobium sp. LHD-90]|uniref:hypothetical protein n=1 Tax=Mesorhizobium sp. LHD-90 TaxID=3071414 RepID=UPI0027E0F7FC|nr:hypothetical protein [Mesorhizobium sp. LHD-90]MDQ6435079.1 hypothetical protein [Mesorhizobium sp. LHD-90]
MSHVVKTVVAAAMALGSLALAPASHAADYLVHRGKEISACADGRYLAKIRQRFIHQVSNVPNLPNVRIEDFRDIHEHRYFPETEEWPIARRYCGATVLLSDGHQRDLWYLIEGRMGFVGIGENVEFCVSGFDRWFVYNGACRVLR